MLTLSLPAAGAWRCQPAGSCHFSATTFCFLLRKACTVVAAAIIIVEETREKGPGFFKDVNVQQQLGIVDTLGPE